MTPTQSAEEASWHHGLFEVFREMYTVRDFRLVLTAETVDYLREYTVGAVNRAVATEKAAKRLDYLSSEPMVVHIPQSTLYPLYLSHQENCTLIFMLFALDRQKSRKGTTLKIRFTVSCHLLV